MSATLTTLAALVAGLVLVISLVRASMWLTDRKSNDDLSRARPDAFVPDDGGYPYNGANDGVVDQ